MAVQPDIDTFVAPDRPFVVRLRSDVFAGTVRATLSLKIEGKSRPFKIGDRHAPTSSAANSHDVDVEPFFGSKVFVHDWGGASQGDDIVVVARSGGVDREDTGDVF